MLLRTNMTTLFLVFFFANYQTVAALKILKWLSLEFKQASKFFLSHMERCHVFILEHLTSPCSSAWDCGTATFRLYSGTKSKPTFHCRGDLDEGSKVLFNRFPDLDSRRNCRTHHKTHTKHSTDISLLLLYISHALMTTKAQAVFKSCSSVNALPVTALRIRHLE